MKEIPLTQGKVAIVDDEDYEWLNQWKWTAQEHKGDEKGWYAVRNVQRNGKISRIMMHRFIMKVNSRDILVYHKNEDSLCNTRSNLILVNRCRGQICLKPRKGRNFKGICYDKKRNKWTYAINLPFDTKLEASKFYNKVMFEHFGEFAKLNDLSLIEKEKTNE